MLHTVSQGLPYPASRREAANGALASELLARAVDKKITNLSAQWALQLTDPTAVLTLASNLTGISANSDYPVFLDTTQKSVGGSFQSQIPHPLASWRGWYHVTMATEVQCEGAINAGTGRRLRVELYADDLAAGVADAPYEVFAAQEFQPTGGAVNLHLEFVAKLGYGETMRVWFWHNNTSSTVRVNTTTTQWALTRICGDV